MKLAIKLAAAYYTMQTLEMLNIVERVVYGEWEGQGGNKIGQLSNVLFILTGMFLFSRALPRLRALGGAVFLALGISGLLLLSTLWSVDQGASIRSGVNYLAMILGAIGIAGTLDCDEYMLVLARMTAFCAIASAAVLVTVPHLALMDGGADGSFLVRGILPHKNMMGQAMAAGVLAVLHGLQNGHRRRIANIALLGLFLALTLLSKSMTALLMIVFYIAVHLVLFLYRKDGPARLAAQALAVAGGLAGGLFLFLPDVFLEFLGKDPTLTGRSELWAYVWKDIDLRPLLGWGYAAFWSVNNPAALDISNAVKWFVPQAHNGVLEILLNVGYGGGALFAGAVLRQAWQAWQGLGTPARSVAVSSLVSLGGIVILGVSEEVLLTPFQVSTGIFFITGILCNRALLQVSGARRMAQAAPPILAAASRAP